MNSFELLNTGNPTTLSRVIVDSGAGVSVCGESSFIKSLTRSNDDGITLVGPTGNAIKVTGKGLIQLRTSQGSIHLPVYLTPEIKGTLISVDALKEAGVEKVDLRKCILTGKKGHAIKFKFQNGLICLDQETLVRQRELIHLMNIHARMGHSHADAIRKTFSKGCVSEAPSLKDHDLSSCISCRIGKARRAAAKEGSRDKYKDEIPFTMVHSDIAGPINVPGLKEKYVLSFVDNTTGYKNVYFLSHKSDVNTKFKQYVSHVKRQYGYHVRILYTDNGREYFNQEMEGYCKSKGIVQRCTSPYTPQSNGVAERFNLTLMNDTRTILQESGLDDKFWILAARYSTFVRNVLYRDSLGDSPYRAVHGTTPQFKDMHSFGAPVVVTDLTPSSSKLSARGLEGYYLGPSNLTFGSMVYLPKERKFVDSRHVVFLNEAAQVPVKRDQDDDIEMTEAPRQPLEREYSEPEAMDTTPDYNMESLETYPEIQDSNADQNHELAGADKSQPSHLEGDDAHQSSTPENLYAEQRSGIPDDTLEESIQSQPDENQESGIADAIQDGDMPRESVEASNTAEISKDTTDRSDGDNSQNEGEQHQGPEEETLPTPSTPEEGIPDMDDQAEVLIPSNLRSTLVGAKNRVRMADSDEGIYQRTRKKKRINLVTIDPEDVESGDSSPLHPTPSTYQQALNSPDRSEWEQAIQTELAAHARLQTWSNKPIFKPTADILTKTIPTRWVLSRKGLQGETFKARLVARGDQQQSTTFTETYSPTLRLELLRMVMALAVAKGHHLAQVDVRTAYLNAQLDTEVFIWPPAGTQYANHSPPPVLPLNRALYGLRQAGRLWHQNLSSTLAKEGFKTSYCTPSIFLRGEVTIAAFVDDLVILSPSEHLLQRTIERIRKHFEIKVIGGSVERGDNGTILTKRELLGHEMKTITVNGKVTEITLTKSSYLQKIKKEYHLPGKSKLPIPAGFYLQGELKQLELTPKQLRRKIKSLQKMLGVALYITNTIRPDASYASQYWAKFAHYPHDEVIAGVSKLIDYLVATPEIGITFEKKERTPRLTIYTDSDYSSEPTTRKSQNGYLVMCGNAPISWKTKATQLVCQSSTEAEYQALALATNEGAWLKQAMRVLWQSDIPKPLYLSDNQSAIKLALNDEFRPRTKHLDVRAHVVRDRIKAGEAEIGFIKGEDQLADVLTKPVTRKVMETLRPRILDESRG